MTTTQSGNISESVVMSAYIKAGFLVAVPFGNACPYDLVVDNGVRLFKIQVKTGWQRKGCLIYKGPRRIKDSTRDAMPHTGRMKWTSLPSTFRWTIGFMSFHRISLMAMDVCGSILYSMDNKS